MSGWAAVDRIISLALEEDLPYGDVTSEGVLDESVIGVGCLLAKSPLVVCGLPVAFRVFSRLDDTIRCEALQAEGTAVPPGTPIAQIHGPARSILAAERTALNFLQRMCGIATAVRTYVQAARESNPHVRVVDTRKTAPGQRFLDKWAVRTGGGTNHRFSLSDAVLIKDNHIAAAGSVAEAVDRARRRMPYVQTVEVEAQTEEQVREALEAGVDIIMLDNMDSSTMARMVELINGQAMVEASGGVTLERIAEVAATGVDVISVGALTHSVQAADVSLEFELGT